MSDSGANTNGNPPRLFITNMVLENFKSYGGVRDVGPFHKRFSSIVGPNGSGKSNVIDAMLFVFGKKAKKLRLNKVSELIHKSDGFQNLEYCRVSVHFVDIIDNPDDDDGFDTVPGTELVVTRIAYKNNSSKYLLDNKTSTFTEVGAILRKRGIDLDNNRFLILQGEVEQIAMMQPKAKNEHEEGLLEFLEDIIGSNRHLEQINIEEKKLDVLNEERGEKLARLKVTETERDNLEGSKSEAEGVVRKSREVREKKNKLYQKYCADARTVMEKINEQKEELVAKRLYENNKLREKEAELELEEQAVQVIMSEHETICEELRDTKSKFNAFERQDIKMREDIKHNKGAVKKLTATIKSEESKVVDLTKAADAFEASLPNLNNSVEALTAKQLKEDEKLEKLLEAAKGESDKLRSGLEAKQIAIAPVKQQVSEVEAKIGTTTREIQLVKDSATSAQAEVDKLEKELAHIDQEQATKKAEMKAAQAQLAELESEQAEDDTSAMAKQESELAKNMSAAISKCEEAKSNLSAQSNRSGMVSQIMAACRSGKPLHGCGLLGRLGDLASIDSKYDVAISTSCGALDHLVVTNADGASKAIAFLKKYNIGRASFIVLDSIRAKYSKLMDMPFETPKKSERLFDLVQTNDPEVKLALYFALRNTLVSKNLDEASSVAYVGNRTVHRVVTLNGELIEQSGAMSGGGNRVKKGSMTIGSSAAAASSSSSSASEEDVTSEMVMEFEKLAASASEKLASFRQKMAAVRSKKAADAETIKKLKKTIPKLEMSICSAVEMLPELKSRREALLPKCKLTKEEASRVQKLEAVVEKARSDASDITNEFKVLQMDIDDLQAAILAAGGEPVKLQRKKVAATKEALEEAESKVSAAQVDAKDSRKASEKAQKTVEKAKDDLIATEEKQKKLLEECAQLENSAQEVSDAYEAAVKLADEKKELLKKVTKELEASQKLVSKIKAVEGEISIQLEDYEVKLKQNQGQLKQWTSELVQLNAEQAACLKDWGDLKQVEESEEPKSDDAAMEEDATEEAGAEADKEEHNDTETKSTKRSKRSGGKSKEDQVAVLQVYTAEQLDQYERESLKYEIISLEETRDKLAQSVNMSAIQEYRNKAKEYSERFQELDEVTERRDVCRNIYEEMRRKRLEEFMVGFGDITLKLKEMYQMITLGGDAELELVDSLDPFSEGIVFSVRPPKKSWKNIANLSGGEKTLSSLALVFALHHYKPTPLYVMDEIDAALDFKNVSIVANYIKERTKNAQFVIISLRNNMFELADRLVGIYKTNDTTKSVTINPKLFGGPEMERLSRQVANAAKDVANPLRNLTNISAAATVN